jgi:hypothetical protein
MSQLAFVLENTSPATWLVPGVGVTVAAAMYAFLGYTRRWLRRRRGRSREEDLSWAELLESLRRRRREREKAGLAADEDMPPDELLKDLLGTLPAGALRGPAGSAEDLQFQAQGGVERRAGQRRWGNPTEVRITLPPPLWPSLVHGLVINRSTGGLAVLLQEEVPVGTSIKVHPVEAPRSVPLTEVEVCHCRKAGRLFLVGGQFCEEVPWNVRVWFG